MGDIIKLKPKLNIKTMKTIQEKGSLINVNEVSKKKSGKNKQLIKRKAIKDSPFEVITRDGVSFGVMGQYRLTEERKTRKEVIDELSEITWNRVIQVYMILGQMGLNVPRKDGELVPRDKN